MIQLYTVEQMAEAEDILRRRQEIAEKIRGLNRVRNDLTKVPTEINYRSDPAIEARNQKAKGEHYITNSELHLFGRDFFRRHSTTTWMDLYLDWSWDDIANSPGWGPKRLGELDRALLDRGIKLKDSVPYRIQATDDNEFRFRGYTV
jgi:hypothetical protein